MATKDDVSHISQLLMLPLELQIKIYRMVFKRGHMITTFNDEPRYGGGRLIQNLEFTEPDNRHYWKTRPRDSMLLGLSLAEVGLLSVSRKMRQVTVPIFYGEFLFTLKLPVSMVTFFEDRGQFARENIKNLCIGNINLDAEDEEAEQTLWEDNFAYIEKWLTGLQSLYVHVGEMLSEDDDGLDDLNVDSENMHFVLQRSSMRWFVALAKLRGLHDLRIRSHVRQLHLLPELERKTEVLQQYLQSQVYQPRVNKDKP